MGIVHSAFITTTCSKLLLWFVLLVMLPHTHTAMLDIHMPTPPSPDTVPPTELTPEESPESPQLPEDTSPTLPELSMLPRERLRLMLMLMLLRSLWICWSPIRWIRLWCLPICLRSLPICLWSLLRKGQTLLLRICPICLWSLPIRLWICLGKVNYFSRKYKVIANQKLNSNFSFSFHYWIGFIVVNEFDIKNKI